MITRVQLCLPALAPLLVVQAFHDETFEQRLVANAPGSRERPQPVQDVRFKADRDYDRTGKFFGVVASIMAQAVKVQRRLKTRLGGQPFVVEEP